MQTVQGHNNITRRGQVRATVSPMTERLEVQARDKAFSFIGELLGSATSKTRGKPRWSEVYIYKTSDGEYVIAGKGCSSVPSEKDLTWAHVCGTPAAAVEQLHQYDDDDIRYITALSKRALFDAGDKDPALLAAFRTENLTP